MMKIENPEKRGRGRRKEPRIELAVERFQEDGSSREASFHLLVDWYYGRVRCFFQRRGVPSADCLDLTQQTFLDVYKGLDRLRESSRFEGFLFATARHRWLRWTRQTARRSRREVALEGSSDFPETDDSPGVPLLSPAASPFDVARQREVCGHVEEAVSKLPERQRSCVELHLRQLRNREIGAVLGITLGAVGAHLHQARRRLKRELARSLGRTASEDLSNHPRQDRRG